LAAYVPAVLSGGQVWTSGQLPTVDGQLTVTGLVGVGPGLVDPEQAATAARTCLLNALAAVASVADLDQVVRVLKLTGYVASAPGFHGQPAVLNGASLLLAELLPESGHARSAVGVAALPLNAPVELDLVVELRRGTFDPGR
jgi:enamine deaminase RidA (YjgF/YER057c/UK114 family)